MRRSRGNDPGRIDAAFADPFGLIRNEAPLLKEKPVLVKRLIDVTEKTFLIIIALFTVGAMVQEVMTLIDHRKVELNDLLLMFIYADVLAAYCRDDERFMIE